MSTVGLTREQGWAAPQPLSRESVVTQVLLGCGVLAFALYVATDVLGGLLYPGYSFYSKTISELAAIGAPSKAFVDPLFNAYDVFALAFALGVLGVANGNRILRITGGLLAAHALAGLAALVAELSGLFPSFAVPQRGTAGIGAGVPHLALMGVIVLLMLAAMGFGAFTLGKRFRIYSFATMAMIIALGAVMGASTARIAAGEPTPGIGILERVMVYATVGWPGVLGLALLRRLHPSVHAASPAGVTDVGGIARPVEVANVPRRTAKRLDADRAGPSLRTVLLTCGVLAPLPYLAADIFGGLLYDGYSFSSQMVSELMAVGAPSERFVDPLFLLFGVLAVAFGIAVYREGSGGNRRLQIAGALLAAYGAIGFTGPTLFEMHPRASPSLEGDTPHIVLTAVLVVLTLAAIGFAAFALGKRFRLYSLATLAIVIAFGAVAAPSGARLAAGEPTPGFGIIERINIYASLLWIAVLAIALLRRPQGREERVAR